jgi:hypothetical protein
LLSESFLFPRRTAIASRHLQINVPIIS